MIAVERRDACVVLRLQRPDVGNAFNDQLIAQLLDVLDDSPMHGSGRWC